LHVPEGKGCIVWTPIAGASGELNAPIIGTQQLRVKARASRDLKFADGHNEGGLIT
jgi:hypothetical protein